VPVSHLDAVRRIVQDALHSRGANPQVGDRDSLFATGLLDSLAAINLILVLERDFGVDFASLSFDAAMIDTIADIAALADSKRQRGPHESR
jgi:acyl carrier protein